MKQQLRYFAILVAVAVMGTSLGCSNKMSFEQDSAKALGDTGNGANGGFDNDLTDDDLPGRNDPGTQIIASTCEAAQAAGTLRELSTPLAFPDPGRACAWNTDGNLGRRDQYHQGRIQQSIAIDLPAGSTLCHVRFDFQRQAFRFDDHFWLTFNGVILAASINYNDRFGKTNGLTIFDWGKIVGTNWDDNREGVHCLAGAACDWPRTDTEGTISMNFRTGTYYAVTARDRARTRHEFSFITVGDNDGTDCQHRPVNLNATLQYVQ